MENALRKEERLYSRKLIEDLFNSGQNHALSAFPVRSVYMLIPQTDNAKAKILVSVPKRRFRQAVRRNRIKRQLREAYRKNKQLLSKTTGLTGQTLLIAFIWISDQLTTTTNVEQSVRKILQRVNEKL